MKQGYTKSWRKKYYGKTARRGLLYIGAMDWLVGNANFLDGWADGQKCGRGQLYIGRADLAAIWRVSEQTVRTILKNLEKDEFITSKSTNKGTIITITNYDTYQSDDERNQPANQPTPNQQKAENQPANQPTKTIAQQVIHQRVTSTHKRAINQQINQPASENQPLTKNNIYINKGADFDGKGDKNHGGMIAPPTEPGIVKTEAFRIGYAMSDERALEFLQHYEALGWRLNGGYIVDWRKLLPRWKVNENRKGSRYADSRQCSIGRKVVAGEDEFAGITTTQI